jgi:hypothetical protein
MTLPADNEPESRSPASQPKQHKPLSHRDAEAACPDDGSVCGEEDPGSALESLMDDDK